MTPRRQRLAAAAGLAGIAVLGAVAVVLLWNGGSSDGPEPTVSSPSGIDAYADLDPYKVHFGDTLTAKVEVTVDRSAGRPRLHSREHGLHAVEADGPARRAPA